MKRKLINFDVFNQLQEKSLTKCEKELTLAEEVLSKSLGINEVKLHSFTNTDVTYETSNGTYIHAGFSLKENNIIFENMEELVIDNKTESDNAKKLLAKLVEEVVNNNKQKANELFDDYMSLNNIRRELKESVQNKKKKEKKKFPFFLMKFKNKKKKGPKVKVAEKKLKEWANLCENVCQFIDYKQSGYIQESTRVKTDDRGNVVAMKIPTSKLRNENKVLSFNWKTLNTEVQVLRNKAKGCVKEPAFAHAVDDLKSANATSDNSKMENVIEAIITRWPNLVYLTQKELSENIKEALSNLNSREYDDDICDFLAEGILRKSTEVYSERVNKILKLAGTRNNGEDLYETLQNTVQNFYSKLDESTGLEMQVFVDLYNTLNEVNKFARSEGDAPLYKETNNYLRDLYNVIQGKSKPRLDLVEEVSSWLSGLVETNLETSNWDVSNTPYVTISGDNPEMAKKAKMSYTPANDFSGDWGDPAPVSNGEKYGHEEAEEMRYDALGNIGKDTWPNLDNPYILDNPSKIWKMKGEKNAVDDGDDDLGMFQSKDTWPNLDNPYVPKSLTPSQYKAKSDDLVADQ